MHDEEAARLLRLQEQGNTLIFGCTALPELQRQNVESSRTVLLTSNPARQGKASPGYL